MIEIRPAIPEDSAAIHEVHTSAFGGPVEAKLVRLISERKKALNSLVAVNDGAVVPVAVKLLAPPQTPKFPDPAG